MVLTIVNFAYIETHENLCVFIQSTFIKQNVYCVCVNHLGFGIFVIDNSGNYSKLHAVCNLICTIKGPSMRILVQSFLHHQSLSGLSNLEIERKNSY
jgi:hypothetical protein